MNLDTIVQEMEFELKIQRDVIERNPQGLVILDYQTRMELWYDQIIPDRMAALRREPTYEYGHRMAALLFGDYFRLQKRAEKESKYFDGIHMIGCILLQIIEYREVIENEIIKNSIERT